jgi:3-methyladenine DNA glycosylase AlkD
MRLEALRNSIVRDLKSRGTPGGNPKLQAYLGSPYPALGLSTPQMREVRKARESQFKQLNVRELNTLSGLLWAGPTLEEKSIAISLYDGHSGLLDDESWSVMNRWIEQASGWALCDSLGSGPISSMLYRDHSRFEEVLEWTLSANLWRRRVSAYAMRSFVFAGELERPFTLLERLLYDKEFWVQRAVGTWLRECWKKDRRKTEAFLLGHVRGLPRVVITVATERAPRIFKEELRRKRK